MKQPKITATEKTFFLSKKQRAQLNVLYFQLDGAKFVAKFAVDAVQQIEQAFQETLNDVRASLGITETDGLNFDIDAGTVTVPVKLEEPHESNPE